MQSATFILQQLIECHNVYKQSILFGRGVRHRITLEELIIVCFRVDY